MAEFPREFFNSGDSPQKLLDHKLLNWIIGRCSRDITVGDGLILFNNPYAVTIGLSKFITNIRVVELTQELRPYDTAQANTITVDGSDDEFVITVDDSLAINVIDVFNHETSIIGTRGIAIQLEFTKHGNWIFLPVSAAVISSSSSSRSSSQSGDDINECNVPPPRPSDINGRIKGTIQLLGVDQDGCWRLYSPETGCSSSGA